MNSPKNEWYAEVILPLATPPLTFAVDEAMLPRLRAGSRVIVPLGQRKFYAGVVLELHRRQPAFKRIKTIESIVDAGPVATPGQLRLWAWIASYYLCPIGMVMRAALPAGLKLDGYSSAEARSGGYSPPMAAHVSLHPSIRTEADLHAACDSLGRARGQYRTLMEVVERIGPERLFGGASPGDEDRLSIPDAPSVSSTQGPDPSAPAPTAQDPSQPVPASPKALIPGQSTLAAPTTPDAQRQALRCVPRAQLTASPAVIKALIDKKILSQIMLERPVAEAADAIAALPALTEHQRRAYEEIRSGLANKEVALLHGVTGSGKTEIYIHLIAAELEKGCNVLYMLPEIALTAQLIDRLEAYFGDRVVVCHSRLSDNRRAETYRRLLAQAGEETAEQAPIPAPDCVSPSSAPQDASSTSTPHPAPVSVPDYVSSAPPDNLFSSPASTSDPSLAIRKGLLIVGVRSSVLLPTPRLSLIVIDEEHENSFKQSDTAPRYHARDTAIVLAGIYGAKTLLGSATPSAESYYNAVVGKYAHVTLTQRYSGVSLPRILVSDTLRAAKRGEKRSHFTKLLLDQIDAALQDGRQVILFQNRRGFSPYVECGNCGWTASCPDCNVTLTYHKAAGSLRCHYCGHQTPVPRACPACKAEDLQPRGFGTEKVEEQLQELFPHAVIDRLDADTANTMRGYRRIISAFENGQTDILVGTQMVTKGFDFGNVALVGILNADNMLNYPDFRASERAFQLMTQVGGRAGRRETQGTVVIQTSQPGHPVIGQVAAGDYEAMAGHQLLERQSFLYPPYCRLIAVVMRHRDRQLLWQAAAHFEEATRTVFGRRLLGPEAPPVDRIKGEYLVQFLLKVEKNSSVVKAKALLLELFDRLHAVPEYKSIGITVDVDP